MNALWLLAPSFALLTFVAGCEEKTCYAPAVSGEAEPEPTAIYRVEILGPQPRSFEAIRWWGYTDGNVRLIRFDLVDGGTLTISSAVPLIIEKRMVVPKSEKE